MILTKIRETLAAQFECSIDEISPDTNVMEDLGADSLDLVELISDLENEYGIAVTDESIYECHTVGEIAHCIERLVP